MELNLNIEYEQLLFLIKQLPANQIAKLKTDIDNNFIHIDKSSNIDLIYKIEDKQISDSKQNGNYNKQQLLLAFERAKQKGVFQNINNSVTWQKKIRNEWE